MTKSNGIASLKQAAKLLNKHSPDGESLAYINPEEAKLLRSHGGSGIMTLQGVPTYGAIWDFTKQFIPETWHENLETVGNILKPLNPWKNPTDAEGDPIYNEKTGELVRGRSIVQDAMSVWVGLRAKKEKEGLNAAEMEQFNKLNQQLAAAETEFDVSTDFGTQLKAPQYTTDVADVAAYTPIDFSGSATPDLTIDAKAYGGRIGFNSGGSYNDWLDYRLKQIAKGLLPVPFKEWKKGKIDMAQGGRIGAFNGGIQGLMPQQGMQQQGFMPQPGLDPRMGYAYGNPHGVEKFDLANLDSLEGLRDPFVPGREDREGEGFYQDEFTGMRDPFVLSDEMKEIQKDYDIESMRDPFKPSREMQEITSLVQALMQSGEYEITEAIDLAKQMLKEFQKQGKAQGGRIGAQGGGIMPLLDMGGMEKDYRQDGGFVPIGRKEKADDVPARLSKNEFVFTADAVKAAGGGDIDQGAQRMYNVMKNLEAGGEISKQSQGQG